MGFYVAPVVGVVTDLGYAYCADCAARLEQKGDPIKADNSAYFAQPCDRCGRVIAPESGKTRRVHVDY